MDPVTAALNLSTAIVGMISKVWDKTPEAQQSQTASDIQKTLHNMSEFVISLQDKINHVAGVSK